MEKLQPKLRFPEFEGDWHKNSFGSIGEIKMCKRILKEQTNDSGDIPFYKIGTFGSKPNAFISKDLFDSYRRKYSFPKVGEILISAAGTIGRKVVYDGKPAYFQDSNIVWLSHNESILKNTFLSFIYSNIHWQTENTTIPRLYNNIIREKEIVFPTLPEQTKIASFLTTVDEKIYGLKKQLSLLERYKKGVMQKIFSQELRFKDENDNGFPDWEEKILSEIISSFIVPMRDKPKELDGEIPWCRIEDFVGKYLEKSKSNQGVSVDTVKMMNLKIFPINTLLVSCSANLGFCAIVKTPLITNQTFIGLVPNMELIDVEFLYYTMRLSARKLNTLSSGTTISYLSREQFEKFSISIPPILEQKKIAAFLTSIDEKIEKCQGQIQSMEKWKKGLLQQMFV